jgi:hypothetical protein
MASEGGTINEQEQEIELGFVPRPSYLLKMPHP